MLLHIHFNCALGIWIKNIWIMNFTCSVFRCRVFKWWSGIRTTVWITDLNQLGWNSGPFVDWTTFDHLNTKLKQYSDPHCITQSSVKNNLSLSMKLSIVTTTNSPRLVLLKFSILSQDEKIIRLLHWHLFILFQSEKILSHIITKTKKYFCWLQIFSLGQDKQVSI